MQGTYQLSVLVRLAVVCMHIEQLMGSAQDIEGVIDHDNDLHIVQSRPQVLHDLPGGYGSYQLCL